MILPHNKVSIPSPMTPQVINLLVWVGVRGRPYSLPIDRMIEEIGEISILKAIESKQRANQDHPNLAGTILNKETNTKTFVVIINLLPPLMGMKIHRNFAPMLKAENKDGKTVACYLVILQAITAKEELQPSLMINKPLQKKYPAHSRNRAFVFSVILLIGVSYTYLTSYLRSGEGRQRISGIRAPAIIAKTEKDLRPRIRTNIGEHSDPIPLLALERSKSLSIFFPREMIQRSISNSMKNKLIAVVKVHNPWKIEVQDQMKKKFVAMNTTKQNESI